jgi:hypothetical protein
MDGRTVGSNNKKDGIHNVCVREEEKETRGNRQVVETSAVRGSDLFPGIFTYAVVVGRVTINGWWWWTTKETPNVFRSVGIQ